MMKISFDIDCTPEEARRFMGLPDLSPIHEAYVGRMTKAVSESMTVDGVADIMRSWGPMGEAGTQMMKTMFDQMAGSARKT